MTAGLAVYRLATGLLSPLAAPWLRRRVAAGKEDAARWTEKLGRATAPRPAGRLAWLHGASVGESLSLLPLAERLAARAESPAVLLTSGTRAAAQLLETRRPAGAVHQFAPLDTPGATTRFLDHWRPDLAVFAESELWPNLILGARARGARLALVSAKLSAASLAGWRRAPATARRLLGAFDLVLARDEPAAAGLASLGARVDGLADLKFGAPPLPADMATLEALRASAHGAAVVLAASTHEGEDGPILEAFAHARGGADACLVIAPRHVERGPAIADLSRGLGLRTARRSQGADLDDADVLVADTLGAMGLWYRIAALAVIGGSFVPGGAGGHNPLEAARLGCPFVTGPHVENWPLFHDLARAGATRLVEADSLTAILAEAFGEESGEFAAMARAAQELVRAGDEAARAAIPRILALLDRAP
jgi:3-deoxy-D-manno-octulosonic-acid transferase